MTRPASTSSTVAHAGDPPDSRRTVNGAVLYQARKALGLTTAQVAARVLAADCYMSDSRVSKFERGKAGFPLPKLLAALADAYEITEDEITVPCETCRQPWSTACMEHDSSQQGAAAKPAA